MANQLEEKNKYETAVTPATELSVEDTSEEVTKGRWDRSWPTIACGAGLFSDGYLNVNVLENTYRRLSVLAETSRQTVAGSQANRQIGCDRFCVNYASVDLW